MCPRPPVLDGKVTTRHMFLTIFIFSLLGTRLNNPHRPSVHPCFPISPTEIPPLSLFRGRMIRAVEHDSGLHGARVHISLTRSTRVEASLTCQSRGLGTYLLAGCAAGNRLCYRTSKVNVNMFLCHLFEQWAYKLEEDLFFIFLYSCAVYSGEPFRL